MRARACVTSCLAIILVLFIPVGSTAAPENNVYLEAIGGFGGSYMYMTYAYIGVTADAYSKNIYPAGQVKAMMDETVKMLRKLVKSLGRVRTTNIVESDRKYIDSMIEIFDLLRLEAEALSAFASSNDRADVEKYDQARKKVWPRIKRLLGIK
ncbi:MAG: hypothetical protein SV487_11600 [Thermodesulfobacteriota bacterium]|nr:hypothetical protein [Thermodesulfobacteriota bacterium]